MKRYDVYAIGNAIVDKEFEVQDQFLQQHDIEKGFMTLVERDRQEHLLETMKQEFGLKKRASGGSAANSIIATQYFGGKTFLSCKVANDEAGDFYCHDLKAAGIDTNLSPEREPGVTGKCLVMVTPDAERTMHTFLGVAGDISEKELVTEALIESKYLYIEGYLITSDNARRAAIEAKKIARANNVQVALTFSDPSMVEFFKDNMAEVVDDGVDLLFCNREEAMIWTDTDNIDDAADKLKSHARQFSITLGAEGALVYDGDQFSKISPHPVKAIDTNGAGDMFAGAFLYAITHDKSFTEAGHLASLASATVVTQFGPRLEQNQYQEILQKFS